MVFEFTSYPIGCHWNSFCDVFAKGSSSVNGYCERMRLRLGQTANDKLWERDAPARKEVKE